MAVIIELTDLPAAVQSNELAQAMVDGANAKASRVAPCLTSIDPPPSADQLSEARLVLLGAVKRWADAGSGAAQYQQAGPYGFSVDTRQKTGFNLWPSEIESLQEICKSDTEESGPYSIDTVPAASAHLPWCSLAFGALYCSCGVDIAGEPIFETS